MTLVKGNGFVVDVGRGDEADKSHPMGENTFGTGILQTLKDFAKENPLAAGIVGMLAALGVVAVLMPKKKGR